MRMGLTDQVYETGSSEPDADESGHQLTETDAVRRLENVEVLQHVWNRHQSQCASEA